MSENEILTFKSLRQNRAIDFQFIACAICVFLYIVDGLFSNELSSRFVGVGLFLFSGITIFIGYLSIFKKEIILFSPELWRLRRIEKEKGIDAESSLSKICKKAPADLSWFVRDFSRYPLSTYFGFYDFLLVDMNNRFINFML